MDNLFIRKIPPIFRISSTIASENPKYQWKVFPISKWDRSAFVVIISDDGLMISFSWSRAC